MCNMFSLYLIQQNMVTKMFSNFLWHLLRIWLFCPKLEKNLGKFSFLASLISFVRLPSTMLQIFVDLELPYTPFPPRGILQGYIFWKLIQNATKWAMLALWRFGRLGFLG